MTSTRNTIRNRNIRPSALGITHRRRATMRRGACKTDLNLTFRTGIFTLFPALFSLSWHLRTVSFHPFLLKVAHLGGNSPWFSPTVKRVVFPASDPSTWECCWYKPPAPPGRLPPGLKPLLVKKEQKRAQNGRKRQETPSSHPEDTPGYSPRGASLSAQNGQKEEKFTTLLTLNQQ